MVLTFRTSSESDSCPVVTGRAFSEAMQETFEGRDFVRDVCSAGRVVRFLSR